MIAVKERLELELQEANQEKEQLEKQLNDKPDFGPGEGATFATSWEMTLARRDEVTARIKSLQDALNRVEQGTYGVCQNCGNQIHPERLEILPTTTFCTACAKKQN